MINAAIAITRPPVIGENCTKTVGSNVWCTAFLRPEAAVNGTLHCVRSNHGCLRAVTAWTVVYPHSVLDSNAYAFNVQAHAHATATGSNTCRHHWGGR